MQSSQEEYKPWIVTVCREEGSDEHCVISYPTMEERNSFSSIVFLRLARAIDMLTSVASGVSHTEIYHA